MESERAQCLAPLVPACKSCDLNLLPKPTERELTERSPYMHVTHAHACVHTHTEIKIKLELQRSSRIFCGNGVLDVLSSEVSDSMVHKMNLECGLWTEVWRLNPGYREC